MRTAGLATPRLHLDAEEMPARYGFVPSLNGLRAASILLVVVGHFTLPEKYVGVSAMGVFLFFGISGFLITRLLFAEQKKFGKIAVGGFFFRRYLRLYPVLIVYLALFMPIMAMQGKSIQPVDVASVLLYFTNYLHNHYEWTGGQFSLPIGALWSLAVEEHFYLIMPFAFLLARGDPRKVAAFALAFLILPLCFRFLYVTIWPEIIGTEYVYRPSETRFDSIAVGVLVAALCELEQGRKWVAMCSSRTALAVALGLLGAAFVVKGGVFGDTLRYTIRNIGCGLVLTAMVFGTRLKLLQVVANLRPVDWIGRMSYSLYIWQGGIVTLMALVGVGHHALGGWAAIGGAFVLAALSYNFVEQPALQLKNLRKRAQPATAG